jgi:hypothetical protein
VFIAGSSSGFGVAVVFKGGSVLRATRAMK